MYLVGELQFLLGVQISQAGVSIFITQSKYAANIVKKLRLESAKLKRTSLTIHVKITKGEGRKQRG